MATEIINLTPFPHLRFSNSDNRGLEFGVLALKATFTLDEAGNCALSDEQEGINLSDETFGAVNESSLRQPSDMVGYKPVADIIINATAHAPGGKPAPSWIVGVRVSDAKGKRAEKVLRVFGPRFWVPKWKRALSDEEKREWRKHRDLFIGWELSEPEPILSLPIRYEYAYGGVLQTGIDDSGEATFETFEHNPIGRGMIDREWTDHTKPQPAPQIEFPSEPITDPYKRYYPAGFGPIPPAWLPRRPLGGTFDKAWLDNVWPKWPKDYDFAYNNSAASYLTADGFLEGDIALHLANLHPARPQWVLTIADQMPFVIAETEDEMQTFHRPALDTVYLDIDETDPFEQRLFLTWRTAFHRKNTDCLIIDGPREDENRALVADYAAIATAQHPAPCATYSEALERSQ